MDDANPAPAPLTLTADDGYVLHGCCWRHAGAGRRAVVVVSAATSVRCDYYARFAGWLHRRGFDVLTYDYRGIGGSRPARLRGFEADWLDWGRLDCEAALRGALERFPGQPLYFVGHSVGGFLLGLAPSNARVERAFTVGAQFAYWRDYLPQRRLGMLLRWHVAMPALTALFGYFPGKRLGWLEDTPRGVVRDWTARAPRFEDAYRGRPRALDAAQRAALVERFAGLRAPLLALSGEDDEYGTVAAVQRLTGYFGNSAVTHLHLRPQAIDAKDIGHFAFFHSRFEASLWPIALDWLRDARLGEAALRHRRVAGAA
jgi:predicted alpha/beta hydrolase